MSVRVTINDVAALAGVSRSTVSRALNDDVRVSSDARRAVQRAADILAYTPNPAARSLKSRSTGLIGLVVLEPTGRLFEDPYFARLMRGMSMVLEQERQQFVLLLRQSGPSEAQLEADLVRMHMDGAVLVSLHDRDRVLDVLLARGMPVVTVGRPINPRPVSFVDVDNYGGAVCAVEHLAAIGRRVIATVAMPQDMASGQDRMAGFRSALDALEVSRRLGLEIVGDLTYESGQTAATTLLRERPDIDGIFVAAEVMSYGVIAGIERLGLRVPEDVAVVGFDDSPPAARTIPPLTSIRQPVEELGAAVTRTLLEVIQTPDRPISSQLLPTTLVIRGSTVPPTPDVTTRT